MMVLMMQLLNFADVQIFSPHLSQEWGKKEKKEKKHFRTLTTENLLVVNKWIKQVPSGCRRCPHSS